jgi:hypothetical protein
MAKQYLALILMAAFSACAAGTTSSRFSTKPSYAFHITGSADALREQINDRVFKWARLHGRFVDHATSIEAEVWKYGEDPVYRLRYNGNYIQSDLYKYTVDNDTLRVSVSRWAYSADRKGGVELHDPRNVEELHYEANDMLKPFLSESPK